MDAFAHCLSLLKSDYALRAVIGVEMECYVALSPCTPETIEGFWQPIHARMIADGLPLLRIEKEEGDTQFEIALQQREASEMLGHMQHARAIIEQAGEAANIAVSFAAKPFADQPSSGMHIHVHLENDETHNVFYKTEDEISEALARALAGMLASLPLAHEVWSPAPADAARYADQDHVPRSLSWGVNNRYCALRIPATINPFKAIEHRMPAASANPRDVLTAILAGVIIGIEYDIALPEQEFGKPSARPPESWVSFLTPPQQARFYALMGKAANEISDGGTIASIA